MELIIITKDELIIMIAAALASDDFGKQINIETAKIVIEDNGNLQIFGKTEPINN